MNIRRFLFVIAATIFLSACEESDGSTERLNAAQAALNNNKSLWQRSGLTSYQYTYRRGCYCLPEEDIVVVVVNGQVSQAFYTPSGTYLTAQQLVNVAPIEGMFEKVQAAIDQRAFSVTVTYNSQFGYPQDIAIDYQKNLVDDEISYHASNFQ